MHEISWKKKRERRGVCTEIETAYLMGTTKAVEVPEGSRESAKEGPGGGTHDVQTRAGAFPLASRMATLP